MRIRSMLRWTGLLGLALVLPLPAWAAMQVKPVEWQVGKDTFSGVLVYDDADHDTRPGLVMVPNWRGVNDSAVEKAKRLAGDDYVVLVADVYGKGKRPANDTEAGQFAGALKKDPATLRARALAAVAALKAQAGKAPLDPARIGAVGFCFGGTTVLELVRAGAPLAGVVSLHGGLATAAPA
ncbi:dienelactone hydrolase family protein, partial [Xanthomonas sp. SHU 308]|uniref:dienelactone hydrolase family protein n=1 Tax=Xanthomonas sp. SHU 308 TaxID=1591201 RepID=UPI000477E111